MKRQFLVPRVALRERGDDDVVVSRSSFPLFFFFFQTTVVSVSFSVPLCASSSFPPLLLSKEQRERERETRAREEINARKFRTKTKRRLCVFSVVAVDDFFLLLSLLRCVSFKRTKDQPTNTKEEALKVFLCVYIYIYITRGNESRCCVLRARVSLYSSS